MRQISGEVVRSPLGQGSLSVLLGLAIASLATPSNAKDYFLTIGGGYAPKGNQASMEANVLFFETLLNTTDATTPREHKIYFADGDDPEADVQTASHPGGGNTTRRILASLFDWKLDQVEYRDHQILNVTGSNDPQQIHAGLTEFSQQLTPSDRLFIYVTAHGGPDKDKNGTDTKIHCWNRKSIQANQFANWLDAVPSQVPVIMVMAQCYCGGYAHTIFNGGDQEAGLANGLRLGFFAQQHNLPAAGCRPDISNDNEYSSYFWGAICGHSRNGTPIDNVDRDQDGKVSFAEAHVYAVLEGETIDIPLRCTDALLEAYSKTKSDVDEDLDEAVCSQLVDVEGTLGQLAEAADFVNREIILGMSAYLELSLDTPIEEVENEVSKAERSRRFRRRRDRGDYRQYREQEGELKDAIVAQWPELEKVDNLDDLEGVGLNLEDLEAEVKNLEGYQAFATAFEDRQSRKDERNAGELTQVRYKRLLQSIKSAVLARNLPALAEPEVVQRYQQMIQLEQTSL